MTSTSSIGFNVLLVMVLAVLGIGDARAEDGGAPKQERKDPAKGEEFIMKGVALNDLFVWFAKRAGREYHRVKKLDADAYVITGHLNAGDAMQQMRDVAFFYGLEVRDDGKEITILFKQARKQEPVGEPHQQKEAAEKFGPVQIGDSDAPGEDCFHLLDAGLNDILQYFAKDAGLQYFHNADLSGPKWLVSGRICEQDSMKVIKAIADHHQLEIHKREHTIYVLTQGQYRKLPVND